MVPGVKLGYVLSQKHGFGQGSLLLLQKDSFMLSQGLQCCTWRRIHRDLGVSFEVACCTMQRGKIDSHKEQDMLFPSLGAGPLQALLSYGQ